MLREKLFRVKPGLVFWRWPTVRPAPSSTDAKAASGIKRDRANPAEIAIVRDPGEETRELPVAYFSSVLKSRIRNGFPSPSKRSRHSRKLALSRRLRFEDRHRRAPPITHHDLLVVVKPGPALRLPAFRRRFPFRVSMDEQAMVNGGKNADNTSSGAAHFRSAESVSEPYSPWFSHPARLSRYRIDLPAQSSGSLCARARYPLCRTGKSRLAPGSPICFPDANRSRPDISICPRPGTVFSRAYRKRDTSGNRSFKTCKERGCPRQSGNFGPLTKSKFLSPLTLALSPRRGFPFGAGRFQMDAVADRESLWTSAECNPSHDQSSASAPIPSPRGEGQGEGTLSLALASAHSGFEMGRVMLHFLHNSPLD